MTFDKCAACYQVRAPPSAACVSLPNIHDVKQLGRNLKSLPKTKGLSKETPSLRLSPRRLCRLQRGALLRKSKLPLQHLFCINSQFFHQTANLNENQAVASRGKLIARFSGVQSTRFRKKMSLTHVSHKFEVWGRPLVTARVGQCLATER